MADQIRVHSTEALRSFRPALIRFGEDANAALVSAGANAVKVLETLRRERLPHWKREMRIRSEEAVRANTKLVQQTAGDDPRPSVDARKAYELAKRRVKEAEDKHELTLRWVRTLEKEIEQYRTAISPMATIARSSMPAAISRLDQTIAALDAYAANDPPPNEPRSTSTHASEPRPTPEEPS